MQYTVVSSLDHMDIGGFFLNCESCLIDGNYKLDNHIIPYDSLGGNFPGEELCLGGRSQCAPPCITPWLCFLLKHVTFNVTIITALYR